MFDSQQMFHSRMRRIAFEPRYRDGIVLLGVGSLWIEVEQARQPGGT